MATAASPFRARRLEEQLSVEQVAAQAGCSGSTIRLIEQGWMGFSQETGERIARALGLHLDDLVDNLVI
jgi:transcriptional regulator with XRE-family HTH domain